MKEDLRFRDLLLTLSKNYCTLALILFKVLLSRCHVLFFDSCFVEVFFGVLRLIFLDQYGNYVIQHLLVHGKLSDRIEIARQVRGKILQYSQHKFASNVIEKCVQYGDDEQRKWLIEEICADPKYVTFSYLFKSRNLTLFFVTNVLVV